MLGCLREQVEDLAAACKEEVFKRQLEAANDWRTDKELKDACKVGPAKVLLPGREIWACPSSAAVAPALFFLDCLPLVLSPPSVTCEDVLYAPQGDVESNCKTAKPESGEVQECLASNRNLISWECQEQLFRQEVENAEDIRLSIRLFKACINDKKKVCISRSRPILAE
jgi:Golgi apparatus protein 1